MSDFYFGILCACATFVAFGWASNIFQHIARRRRIADINRMIRQQYAWRCAQAEVKE